MVAMWALGPRALGPARLRMTSNTESVVRGGLPQTRTQEVRPVVGLLATELL